MRRRLIFVLMVCLAGPGALWAHAAAEPEARSFDEAAASIRQQLEESLAELSALREQAAAEMVPLNRRLSELEARLSQVRLDYQQTSRLLDSRTLDLSNLRSEIKSRQEEATYLSNLLGEYIRNFESRLHIAEIQRYRESLDTALLAPENSNLTEEEVYAAQTTMLSVSLERLHEALGGTTFDGSAVDPSGLVKNGTFVQIGPAAIFRSEDGQVIGTIEQRLGSLEPTVVPFTNPLDAQATAEVIYDAAGRFPLDPTLGNAHKIEQTRETLLGHIRKGGPVMIPIFVMAGAALLVAVFKWIGLVLTRTPSQKAIRGLLDALSQQDEEAAQRKAGALGGPVGRMLRVGVEHLREPRELIEEVMYEKIMEARLKLERFLPFVAISAASAPLLGLLGTVTGIINTFKLITVFGSGDVKTLSGGISEALITTEFGLIVAIPSLLIHAFLSRRARGIVNQMEKAAAAFVNQVSKTPFRQKDQPEQAMSGQVTARDLQEFLENIKHQIQAVRIAPMGPPPADLAESLMNRRLVTVDKSDTVAQAISKIRLADIGDDLDTVYVIDENGKYAGYVKVRHLLTRPEQTPVDGLLDNDSLFVRVDTHCREVQNLFRTHDLFSMPVLDHDGRLVGRVIRNGDGCKA